MSPYRHVYWKACHLSNDLDHKTMLAIKRLNLDLTGGLDQKLKEFNVDDKLHLKSYEIQSLTKIKMNMYHDQIIDKREVTAGDLVILFHFRIHLFSGKLKY